ncbi:protein cereblon-like isoform X3 [Dreissena polymorpha]|uniref:protein cereblon-like isoform X2 n=1 Tax=Dreissena polymorpha TaxID=45954 RepID=UPI002263BDF0|nr:protein cereblon-like isoform X2 [Dreissena polymorpha]XP_052285809.1 protein cereblon-like isoform X3 [Dreissena polymorpha]
MAEDEMLPFLEINVPPDAADSSDSDSDGSDPNEMGEEEADYVVEGRAEHSNPSKVSSSTSFDSSLPSSHTYLGTDLEEISGRTILDDDSEMEFPLVTLPGTILVPGHVIPLYSHNQHEVAMLKSVVDSPHKTFGVVALRFDQHRHIIASIGTTAEIYSVKNETDEASGISTITVLAQGRQRFELIEYRRTITGVLLGKIRILPDAELGNALYPLQSSAQRRLCCHSDREEDMKVAMDSKGRIISCVRMKPRSKLTRFSNANLTWWPPWVYKMYDTELVMKRIKTALQKWDDKLHPQKLPSDATKLSYWVTQNIPLDDTLKLHLLSINSPIQRLRCALGIMDKCSVFCCQHCNKDITGMSSIFSMSVSGPLSAYVNPGGHVHETVTVHEAHNLSLQGRPSTEHSWFPGYAWTIAQCRHCYSHMGWKFTATRKELQPRKFWGLCRSSLVPGMADLNEGPGQESSWSTVM